VEGSSWRSGGAGGIAGVDMNRLKTDVLDTCEAGLAGKRVLEQTIDHLKENWPDRRRAKVAVRQLDAVAKCMQKQATTMSCKIGMAVAFKHHMQAQRQQPAAVAQTLGVRSPTLFPTRPVPGSPKSAQGVRAYPKSPGMLFPVSYSLHRHVNCGPGRCISFDVCGPICSSIWMQQLFWFTRTRQRVGLSKGADRLVAFIFVRENENVRSKKCSFKKGTEELAEAGSEAL